MSEVFFRFWLRFNLQYGEDYFKWKLIDRVSNTSLSLPDETNFLLNDCRLRNQRRIAEGIFHGANKSVCAYVEFNDYEIIESHLGGSPVLYNPRVAPYWRDEAGNNLDNTKYETLSTWERRIYN